MAAIIADVLTIAISGTSFSAGIYCTPDDPWPLRLERDLRASPECKGEVRIWNTAKGSQQSSWGVSQANIWAPLKPDVLLKEDFGINDCVALPNIVSLADATVNFNAECDTYLAHNPNIVIIHQTMSPAAAIDANRNLLPDYYENGRQNAAARGILTLDHYASYDKPLDVTKTVNNDALHPLFANMFGVHAYPLILSTMRAQCVAKWG
jgi:hypothetical protein